MAHKKKKKKKASHPWGVGDKDSPKAGFGTPKLREPRSSTGFPGLKRGKKDAS